MEKMSYNNFSLIYQYIKNNILSKYDNLVDCYSYDDEDNENIKNIMLNLIEIYHITK